MNTVTKLIIYCCANVNGDRVDRKWRTLPSLGRRKYSCQGRTFTVRKDMAAGSGAGAASVGIAGSAVVGASSNILRGAAAIASCVAGPTSRISPENFKLWAEHLLRARGDNGICRDPVNSHYLEGDAVAMGYFGQTPMYERFAGPWRSSPLQMHDVDWDPPPEYRINSTIRDKLAPVDLRLYGDDVLFYTFYAFVSEALQILAANELYLRGWRFHIQRRVWLRQTSRSWAIFEPWSWQVVERDLDVDVSLLEGRPFPPKSYCARSSASEAEREVPGVGAVPGRVRPGVPRPPFPQHCHRQGVQAARHHHCHRTQFERRQGECPDDGHREAHLELEHFRERPQPQHRHESQQDLRQRRQLELQQQQRWQHELQQQRQLEQQQQQHHHHHPQGQSRQLCNHHSYQQQQQNLHFHQTLQLQLQQHNQNQQQAVLPSDYHHAQAVHRQLHVQYHQFGGNVVVGLPPVHHGVAVADAAADGRTSVVAAAAVPPDCRVTI
ncbi:uncharacterized protein LOC126210462 isoform X1 [Schistocerca nitens]|uniref:uncharacterized protein LOC126210462 isoform X1 n=2 Tax=Schistocerca nitens TaxID=7011 RepID=UPI002117BE95|nr:uncharacterized protein LOC126210462 isoform X1 [Schistocerca nitens]